MRKVTRTQKKSYSEPVSTISRELDRNKGKKGCRHKNAQGMARHRIAVKAAKRRKFTDKMWKLFKAKLREGWTPQMIVGRCRRDGIPKDMLKTCTLDCTDAGFARHGSTQMGGRRSVRAFSRKAIEIVRGRAAEDVRPYHVTDQALRRSCRLSIEAKGKGLDFRVFGGGNGYFAHWVCCQGTGVLR